MNTIAALMIFAAAFEPHTTLHVSKLGSNGGGRSWATAFTTIQAALDAIPDNRGGYRIAVRPDTYMEYNLSPAFSGAQGAPNELVGDHDGKLGSGRTGWVVIDSSDPQRGFKSYDWYGTIRATQQGWSDKHTDPTFSATIWDRWVLRRLYATGGDGGLFWDGTNRVEPFSILVEDCVSIGRAFGGGVASVLSREEEPITFRRCHLWALDWWGDTSGAYVRIENPAMPDKPGALFEDCTLVGPQCSLKAGNYGFHTYTRVRLERCRLITLNFSQPQGTPTDGIIQSVQNGKYLHAELNDCTLMGYKVFGVKVDKDSEAAIGYTATGATQAYVQFQQEVPKGIHRLGHWPVEIFASLVPPAPEPTPPLLDAPEMVARDLCEVTPFVWKGRLHHLECRRPASGGERKDYALVIIDVETGKEVSRFAEGFGLASMHVEGETLHAFASRFENNDWNDVTHFKSEDGLSWASSLAITQEQEHLFNSSVCKGSDGYLMAYESNDPAYPAFTIKFAASKDLEQWNKLPEATFGKDRYTACPCIRYADGCYYLMYLENRAPRHYFETYIARTKDLRSWELSTANPVLVPQMQEDGINASDPDIVEHQGRTWIYYAVGDQLTWMNIKRAPYAGSESDFFKAWFN